MADTKDVNNLLLLSSHLGMTINNDQFTSILSAVDAVAMGLC